MLRQQGMDLSSRMQLCPNLASLLACMEVWTAAESWPMQLCSCSHLTSRLRMLRSDCAASALLVCLQRSLDHQGSCRSLACIASASVRAAAAPSTLGDSWWWCPMLAAAVMVCRAGGWGVRAVVTTNCCCSLLFAAASISNLLVE